MVFINRIPFLKLDLGRIGTRLRGDEFLQVTHSVVWATLDSNFASQPIVCDNLDEGHCERLLFVTS